MICVSESTQAIALGRYYRTGDNGLNSYASRVIEHSSNNTFHIVLSFVRPSHTRNGPNQNKLHSFGFAGELVGCFLQLRATTRKGQRRTSLRAVVAFRLHRTKFSVHAGVVRIRRRHTIRARTGRANGFRQCVCAPIAPSINHRLKQNFVRPSTSIDSRRRILRPAAA
ncbi:hypothetical protein EVAR_46929_1 [Eumeta japonica]|uniref:Uncharacterized protein n=1 Tax=Eumeta variegata TaxID=151549 RepID=A0A4C1ZZS0_EUMVA|nr:hypothetical protein EVAR_46929_1 [Eumeta japonica]